MVWSVKFTPEFKQVKMYKARPYLKTPLVKKGEIFRIFICQWYKQMVKISLKSEIVLRENSPNLVKLAWNDPSSYVIIFGQRTFFSILKLFFIENVSFIYFIKLHIHWKRQRINILLQNLLSQTPVTFVSIIRN